jgi:hypothetical protein
MPCRCVKKSRYLTQLLTLDKSTTCLCHKSRTKRLVENYRHSFSQRFSLDNAETLGTGLQTTSRVRTTKQLCFVVFIPFFVVFFLKKYSISHFSRNSKQMYILTSNTLLY